MIIKAAEKIPEPEIIATEKEPEPIINAPEKIPESKVKAPGSKLGPIIKAPKKELNPEIKAPEVEPETASERKTESTKRKEDKTVVSVADPQLTQKKVKVSDLQQDVMFAAYAERNNNERLSWAEASFISGSP